MTDDWTGVSLDTAGIGQGRKPRELFCVEFQYEDMEGKRKRAAVVVQRKSDAMKIQASWEKHATPRVPDPSSVHISRGLISWEPLE